MEPPRVDAPQKDRPPVARRRHFTEILRARTDRPSGKPPPPPRDNAARLAREPRPEARPGLAPGQLRTEARKEMDTAARQRLSDGQVAAAQATGRLATRSADLLTAALRSEEARRSEAVMTRLARARPRPTTAHPPGSPFAAAGISQGVAGETRGIDSPGPTSAGRVERALALVDRIERFVRSGRPSLAVTLHGGMPGQLELQRVGPGAISLRLSSPRPPSPSELGELRQALEARGLSVRSLESRCLTASAADVCSPCP